MLIKVNNLFISDNSKFLEMNWGLNMRILLLAVLLTGCGAFKKNNDIEVEDGEGCTVTENEAGHVISCANGSTTIVKNGTDGAPGGAGKNGSRGPAGSAGPSGAKGSSCSVTETETGSTLTCEDGTSSTVNHGSGCRLQEREYGADLICGDDTIPIRHGRNGETGPIGPGGPMGPGGPGMGRGRHCRAQYLSDSQWWWNLDFTVTTFGDDWFVFEIREEGHSRQNGQVFKRQGSVIAQSLDMVIAQAFGASLLNDQVTFTRQSTGGLVRCSLSSK